MGFDFGYAYGTPEGLTIWEAQFGDFNNGHKSSSTNSYLLVRTSGMRPTDLTLFLPHGYEGMGSEHSSGRMERYLQMCAQDNMQVANPTTPANHFHLLRRQVLRPFRKPLVVFTPKKLLRYPDAVSTMADLAEGRFQPSSTIPSAEEVRRQRDTWSCARASSTTTCWKSAKSAFRQEKWTASLGPPGAALPVPDRRAGGDPRPLRRRQACAGPKKSPPTWARLLTCNDLDPAWHAVLCPAGIGQPSRRQPRGSMRSTKPSLIPCSNWVDDLEAHSIHPPDSQTTPCPSLK